MAVANSSCSVESEGLFVPLHPTHGSSTFIFSFKACTGVASKTSSAPVIGGASIATAERAVHGRLSDLETTALRCVICYVAFPIRS